MLSGGPVDGMDLPSVSNAPTFLVIAVESPWISRVDIAPSQRSHAPCAAAYLQNRRREEDCE